MTDDVASDLILYDSKDLTTHAVCVGMTGSGKTGLCLTLLEEAAIDGVPAICIDPKGDLGNLCLSFPDLKAESFRPWIDADEAKRKGRTEDEHATAVANMWREGLAKWGQDGERIAKFRNAVDLKIYTPGSSAGVSVSALRSFDAPSEAVKNDADAMRDRVLGAVGSLLALLGVEADPIQSPEHVLLSNILTTTWGQGKSIDLAGLIRQVTDPPFDKIGVMELESFYPARERQKLAMRLNGLLASPGFAAWMEGEPLDVQKLLWTDEGKPRIAIMSIAHLNDQERMFFVTLLLNEIVSWMRGQSGTSSLRALVYMDEVFGFLPPVADPPSKGPMLTLLKQARAFGVGLILATQNPVDLDYKALSNCGTWFLGRLQTERDAARVLDGLAGASDAAGQGFDRSAMEKTLAGLKSRVFLLNNVHEDAPVLFHTRWALSYLRGPLTREQIRKLSGHVTVPQPTRAVMQTPGPAVSTSGNGRASARPVLPSGVDEVFLSDNSGEYEPCLFAQATLHYIRASASLDRWEEPILVAPLTSLDRGSEWDDAELVSAADLDLFDEAPDEATYRDLPAGLGNAKRLKTIEKALKNHLYQHHPKAIWACKPLKLTSKPEETQADFAARVQLAAREYRDVKVEKLRDKFAPKLKRIQDRIRTAEERVEREKSQYEQQKLQTGISVGATVLGAIFGRRTMGKATTAARGAGRVAREREDIGRAEEKVEDLQDQLKDLEEKFQEATEDLADDAALASPAIHEIAVRPRKGDIDITRFALAWRPVGA